MKIASTTSILAIAALCGSSAFTAAPLHRRTTTTLFAAAATASMAEAGVPPAHSDVTANVKEDVEIPTNLPSDANIDYIPLATMLATGQLAEADQVRTAMFSLDDAHNEQEALYSHTLILIIQSFSQNSLLATH